MTTARRLLSGNTDARVHVAPVRPTDALEVAGTGVTAGNPFRNIAGARLCANGNKRGTIKVPACAREIGVRPESQLRGHIAPRRHPNPAPHVNGDELDPETTASCCAVGFLFPVGRERWGRRTDGRGPLGVNAPTRARRSDGFSSSSAMASMKAPLPGCFSDPRIRRTPDAAVAPTTARTRLCSDCH